jgi:hypothetical protein
MKKIFSILFFAFIAVTVFAQKQENPLVQFSGIVKNADSTDVIVPYVTIVNMTDNNSVAYSNYNGYFSFVAHEQDSIRFSCVGYATIKTVVPAHVANGSLTQKILMKPRITNLPVVKVFPWATEEEFTKEFLTMKIADDDLENARKNLSNAKISALMRTLPRDGLESGMSFQDFHNSMLNAHSITNPLLNPFNWASIIREISEGDKSRASDNAATTPAATSSDGKNSSN